MNFVLSHRYYLLLFLVFASHFSYSQQLPYGLKNGIENKKYCSACQQLITEKPDDVLFGIEIRPDGDVYFLMNNTEWFGKIFSSPSYGVSVDIVSKDRYSCSSLTTASSSLIRGYVLKPVYKDELLKNTEDAQKETVYVKVGTVPAELKGKELEGNLIIVNGEMICYYSNFVNINRNLLSLLPMGLFADTLIRTSGTDTGNKKEAFTYSRRIQFNIPFEKNKTIYQQQDIKPLYDSLNLKDYKIQKIELRAYASVEGPEKINIQLMEGRARSLLAVLKQYQPSMQRISVVTAENWLEFYQDIENTKLSGLKDLSKSGVKEKLAEKELVAQAEALLSRHRKAVVVLYLESAYGKSKPVDMLLNSFRKAVQQKDMPAASLLQRELVDQIKDNKIPAEYLNKLEIPESKEYSNLLNNRETYRYLLKTTSEYEALQGLQKIAKMDPGNGRINYNICALNFFMWQYGNDSTIGRHLLQDIMLLEKQGIDRSLTKRMLINYYILKCEEYNKVYRYEDKDSTLNFIRKEYQQLQLNDEEIYSLAKYFANYAQNDWAEEIITPRIGKIDVSEDLVFYYINLLLFNPEDYETGSFKKAVLNAINLNRKRYCNFFLPNDNGGASMQLLEFETLKSIYCESCNK